MSDLIDRKEAIDALERSKKIYFDRQVIIGAMKDIVRNLPSAQPEIIRCHDCDHWNPGFNDDNDNFIPPKCGKYQQMVGHFADDYCSYAERREVSE